MLDQVIDICIARYVELRGRQDLSILLAVLLGVHSVWTPFPSRFGFWCTAIQGPAQRLPPRLFTDRWVGHVEPGLRTYQDILLYGRK